MVWHDNKTEELHPLVKMEAIKGIYQQTFDDITLEEMSIVNNFRCNKVEIFRAKVGPPIRFLQLDIYSSKGTVEHPQLSLDTHIQVFHYVTLSIALDLPIQREQ